MSLRASPDEGPLWSPDGIWIAFYRSGFVYLIPPEGGPERKVTAGRAFSWTPDGLRIAFDSHGPDSLNIFIVNAQGGKPRLLNEGGWMDFRPSWSRDGLETDGPIRIQPDVDRQLPLGPFARRRESLISGSRSLLKA